MTESQIIAFSLGFAGIVATILIALLLNNSRLTDAKEALRGEIKASDAKEILRAEIKASEAAILSQMATYQMDLIGKIAELNNRITGLER